MTMIGYDAGRLAGLQSRARRAAASLETVRSDDPAAAGAMAAVATARRSLEDGVLGLIARITTSDPMGSWIAAGVAGSAGSPSGWRTMPAGADAAPRNCSQPQPALCENSPVRSWFGPGYEVFGGRVTIVEWLRIEGFGGYAREVRRGDAEWEGMDGIPIVEMFSGGTESTTWTVRNAYVEYSYASVDRGGDMADPVPRAAFAGDVEVTEYREYTTFQPQVGLPVGGPPGSRSGDPTAELDIGIPFEHTVTSVGATYSVRLLQGRPVPVGRPATTAPRRYYREIPLTRLDSADED